MIDKAALVALQGPLKERYRDEPGAAMITLSAEGRLGEEVVSCSVQTGRALVEAGLHPATGGDGTLACSGDMLLEALVACAGVTLRAVATSLEIPVRGGHVRAEGDLDFRGTLGVAKDAPVGFSAVRLTYRFVPAASAVMGRGQRRSWGHGRRPGRPTGRTARRERRTRRCPE